MAPQRYVAADPYPWPYNGDLRQGNTALIVIDMQTDFCGIGGYVDRMGYDLSLTRAPIEPIVMVLAEMRRLGFHIFHTREGHRHDLANLPANNAGGRGASAPALPTRDLAAASCCAASRAGRLSRS
jgi:biuret amidohydrolase